MQTLLKYWYFDPFFVVFIATTVVAWLYLGKGRNWAGAGYISAAMLLVLLCTCSPLHWLAENELFSAHMVAHVILFFIVAPLLVLGIPRPPTGTPGRLLMSLSRRLAAMPWIAWALGVGVMWFWHIPVIFDAGSHMSGNMHSGASGDYLPALLHHAESISLILIGMIFCWPILGPFMPYRIPPLKGVIYLFTACIFCSLLGALITFSPEGIYKHYFFTPAHDSLSSLLGKDWGITPETDRQIAGLIMWVPGCLLYLAGSIYLTRKWFVEKEEPQEKPSVTLNTKNI